MPVLTSSVIITTVTVFVIGSALKAAFAWTRLPRLQLKARRAFEKGDFRKAAQLAEEAFKLSVESHASPAAKQSAENQFNAYMIAAYGQYGAMGCIGGAFFAHCDMCVYLLYFSLLFIEFSGLLKQSRKLDSAGHIESRRSGFE